MANGVSRTRSSTRKPANNRRTNNRATSTNRTKQATQTNKTQNTGRTESRDKLSLSKPEEKPRNDFVNPLENFDKATEAKQQDPNAKSGGDSKASETGKPPEGVNKEQAGQVAQQIQDFSALATHLPTILGMGDQIREGGISSEHVEALKAAYGPMKGVLTPENIQAFKGMDLEAVDKLLSPQNLQMLKGVAPEMAEKLNPEKIGQLKKGLQDAQKFLDKDNLARTMNMMSPFVQTRDREGALNTVARMVDDPNQLGGADRKLSMTDIGQVTNGLLNTGPVRGIVNGKIASGINHAVNYRQDGRERSSIGKALVGWATSRPRIQQKIYSEAWGQVRSQAPGEVRKQAAPYLSQNGSAQDRSLPRRFDDRDISSLMKAGETVQNMRGGFSSTGNQQIDNANQTMAGVTGMLHKSVVGDDGMISGDELRNVSGFGTQLYNYLGLMYQGVGGQYGQ